MSLLGRTSQFVGERLLDDLAGEVELEVVREGLQRALTIQIVKISPSTVPRGPHLASATRILSICKSRVQ